MECLMFVVVMRNHKTWGDTGDHEPCLDIMVKKRHLEVTPEVFIPFSNLEA